MSRPVITLGEARDIALALPAAQEAGHWGNPSFRVGGRIFATMPDSEHMNVMIDPFDVESAVLEEPDGCSELRWGKKVSGTQVDLRRDSPELQGDLLEAAWSPRSPRGVLSAYQNFPPHRRK